jgi:organic radical activating enzyme
MTFVRLAGCNAPSLGLGCLEWCDTGHSWEPSGGDSLPAAAVLEAVRDAGLPRVCLTGGEPLLHGSDFAEMVELLRAEGYTVHLETNGTLGLPGDVRPDWITVSPKPPEYDVATGLRGLVDELKVVVAAGFDAGVVETLAAAHPGAAICLQPEYSRFEVNSALAVAEVMAHPGWRLSLQLHRLLGLR